MVRCEIKVKIVKERNLPCMFEWTEIQCANEKGHVGDHLIVVGDDIIELNIIPND